MKDQRGTPFKENIKNVWYALTNQTRWNRGPNGPVAVDDGRGWLDAVTHEMWNVIVELWRAARRIPG